MSAREACIYLDHNATTRPCAEAVAAMLDALEVAWANPSSTHGPGQIARRLLADSRARVAALLGCQAAELVFTSGATEANHHALRGALTARRPKGRRRLVVSAVEHPGLLAAANQLADEGARVDRIRVDTQGRIDLSHARALLGDDVALVSVMAANNETGVCMPLDELAALTRAAGAWLHVDATQLVGRVPFDFAANRVELLSMSAHKLHGPKGVGALAVRKGVALQPLLPGRQERQRRGGTENLPGIAGFAAACARAQSTLGADAERMRTLRDRLQRGLAAAVPALHIHGGEAPRVPHTLSVRFGELAAEPVLAKLEREGIVASSGAACSAGGTSPSHVLLAMGQSPAQARAGVRFSLGRDTTESEIDAVIEAVRRVVVPLLEHQPLAA